jgi:hypothetical protein
MFCTNFGRYAPRMRLFRVAISFFRVFVEGRRNHPEGTRLARWVGPRSLRGRSRSLQYPSKHPSYPVLRLPKSLVWRSRRARRRVRVRVGLWLASLGCEGLAVVWVCRWWISCHMYATMPVYSSDWRVQCVRPTPALMGYPALPCVRAVHAVMGCLAFVLCVVVCCCCACALCLC